MNTKRKVIQKEKKHREKRNTVRKKIQRKKTYREKTGNREKVARGHHG
jgi:hypothetical protein